MISGRSATFICSNSITSEVVQLACFHVEHLQKTSSSQPIFIRPPGMVVPTSERPYILLLMFYFYFFRHAISELPRPIAVKRCHMMAICVCFVMQVQKFGGPPPNKLRAQNMQICINFIQLHTVVVNISGTDPHIENRKSDRS